MKNKTETLRDPSRQTRSGRLIKYTSDYVEKCTQKRERQSMIYQVKKALNKCTNERTKDDNDLLVNCQDLVKHVDIAKQNRLIAQAHQEIILDDQELLEMKCKELVKSIIAAKSCVFYTGKFKRIPLDVISGKLFIIIINRSRDKYISKNTRLSWTKWPLDAPRKRIKN